MNISGKSNNENNSHIRTSELTIKVGQAPSHKGVEKERKEKQN